VAATIGPDGAICTEAVTQFPLLSRSKTTLITTRLVATREGLRMITTMPGVVAKRYKAVTTVSFTALDLAVIIRHRLRDAKAVELPEKLRAALVGIPEDTLVGWIKYFLQQLA